MKRTNVRGGGVRIVTGTHSLYECNGKNVSPCNKLYRKELFKDHRFIEGKRYEDLWFTCYIMYAARKVAFTSYVLYFYNRREGNTTDNTFKNGVHAKLLDGPEGYVAQIAFFKKHGLDEIAEYNSQYAEERFRVWMAWFRRENASLFMKFRLRIVYFRFLLVCFNLWGKKQWLERAVGAISPGLLESMYKIYHMIIRNG